jgi:hypothetical protein
LYGASQIYVNMTPLFGKNQGLVAGVATAPIILLIFLFTGPLTRGKARLLFSVTYVLTFASCAIPIVLIIAASQNPYLMKMMDNAPVGIVISKADGIDQQQWILNIGGSWQQPEVTKPNSNANTTTLGPPQAGQDTGASKPPADTSQPGSAPPPPMAAGAPEPSRAVTPASVDQSAGGNPPQSELKGGLAIPIYVIILATVGAGINMTRKVPEIQRSYDSVGASWRGALSAPLAVLGIGVPSQEVADPQGIRKELIETYMYFVSAPFLAIAVYYLLQVVAKTVGTPTLVVIAFATGLMSNTVIGSIIAFADKMFKKVTAA